jgi:hypothetical protein
VTSQQKTGKHCRTPMYPDFNCARHRRAYALPRRTLRFRGGVGAIVVSASVQMRPLFNLEDGGPGVKHALIVWIAKAFDDHPQIVMPQ